MFNRLKSVLLTEYEIIFIDNKSVLKYFIKVILLAMFNMVHIFVARLNKRKVFSTQMLVFHNKNLLNILLISLVSISFSENKLLH